MKRKRMFTIMASVAVLLIAAYWLYDYYAGNHVEVTNVVNSSSVVNNASPLDKAKTDKTWTINREQSRVFFSVTTSKEAVAFEASQVEGSWDFRSKSPEAMKASAKIDMNAISSGNSGRDNDVKGKSFNVSSFPDASFTLTSVNDWPSQWCD